MISIIIQHWMYALRYWVSLHLGLWSNEFAWVKRNWLLDHLNIACEYYHPHCLWVSPSGRKKFTLLPCMSLFQKKLTARNQMLPRTIKQCKAIFDKRLSLEHIWSMVRSHSWNPYIVGHIIIDCQKMASKKILLNETKC